MLINEIKPSPSLVEFIRQYRIIDFNFPSSIVIPFKAYPPRPEHCLQLMARDSEWVRYPDTGKTSNQGHAIFMGPHTQVIHRYPSNTILAFQIIFQPGTIHQLTRTATNELINSYLNAEDLFGKEIQLVTEQLFHAKDYSEIIYIIELYLHRTINKVKLKKHPIDDISKIMINEHENFSLDKFFNAAHLSIRQFDRKFKEHIGMNPKLFLRMSRFDKAFRMKNRYPQLDWLTIALYCGYHDYQHLAKDYKEFTGHTPSRFYTIEKQAPERILGDLET